MNFKGLKHKLQRFNAIFTDHWSAFVISHPRYDTDYYHAEISKMLVCSTSKNGFAVHRCLECGHGEHTVNFSCKGKGCLTELIQAHFKNPDCKIAVIVFLHTNGRDGQLCETYQLRRVL